MVWTWGGDACVALVLLLCTRSPSSQGDASVPSPHNPSPAPTGTKGLPGRGHTIPIRESISPALRVGDFPYYSSGTSSNKSDTETPRAFASRSSVVVFTPLKGSLHILLIVKKDTSEAPGPL